MRNRSVAALARGALCSGHVEAYAQPCVYEDRPGAAAAPLPRRYRQRQPHQTVLHRLVRENLETFLAEGVQQSASGEGYPFYVEKELRDYVSCADMSRGFARVRCTACGHELLLPFSCKNRGLCPSCTTRRMSDEAAYLVDMVLPEAPYRQWTLTFPFALRFLLARDYKLITAVLGSAVRIIFSWQRRQARRAGHRAAKTAAVAFVQRFGGALNCNVHAHALLPDGVFVLREGDDALSFVPLPPPDDKDVLHLTRRLARRVTALLERRFATLEPAEADLLEGTIGESMRQVPAASAAPDGESAFVRTSRRAASVDGFSIHANTAVPAHNRLGLEMLCRYGMRPAFSHERISLSADGQVLLALRRPWPTAHGVSVLCFSPVAFLRRLAPLIPPPFAHLVRHYGLFAPNAKGRDLLPAAPVSPAGIRLEPELRRDLAASSAKPRRPEAPPPSATPATPADPPPKACLSPGAQAAPAAARSRTVLPWSELLRRVFAVDVLVCPRCLGPMTVVAYLTDHTVVAKILTHLGLPTTPLRLSPARLCAQVEMFDDDLPADLPRPALPRTRGSRAPPRGLGDDRDDADDTFDWGA